MVNQKLRILSLGGFAEVTQNLFVYETDRDILLVDCGIGFLPEDNQEGDLLIPDINYLLSRRQKIRGLVLTHGHEDHIGGLPFILPRIGSHFPIYGSRWTVALAQERLGEFHLHYSINQVDSQDKIVLGDFRVEFVYVNHSIPETYNLLIKTPLGTIYHASDFKFDWTPVMQRQAEVNKIACAGNDGILLLLSDCLRSEKPGYTLSEEMIEQSLEREIIDAPGRVFITTMSSNVSRWQQAANVCIRHNRRILLLGFSIKKIVQIARQLGYLHLPKKYLLTPESARLLDPRQVAVFISGSQAQANSALVKISQKHYKKIDLLPQDKVIISSDYIPGNEAAVYRLIDNLSRLGASVSYSDIRDDLHVSGHASTAELALMINLLHPKFLVPIGGTYRHMAQYSLLAQKMGYRPEQILLPFGGQSLELSSGAVKLGEVINVNNVRVKGK